MDQVDPLADIAQEIGLDRSWFLADFAGQAQDEFARDRLECQRRDVRGFPTFLIAVDGKERLARGYRTYEQLAGLIDLLAGEDVERHELEFSDLSVLDFVEKYGSAAAREVAEVFGVSDAAAKATLDRLVVGGTLELPAPGLLYRTIGAVSCDARTGECLLPAQPGRAPRRGCEGQWVSSVAGPQFRTREAVMRTVGAIAAGVLVGILLAGCSFDFSAQDLPEGEPDIRGVVTMYEPGAEPTDLDAEPTAENYPGMLVVWTDDPSVGVKTEYDAAQVQTDGPTLFFSRLDGEYVGLEDPDGLKVGSIVEVWFRGAVRESYPVQATAGSVVVVGDYSGDLPAVSGLEP